MQEIVEQVLLLVREERGAGASRSPASLPAGARSMTTHAAWRTA